MSNEVWGNFIYGLQLMGFEIVLLLIICIACVMILLIVYVIQKVIQKARRKRRLKHRFNRKPIATCYCQDCRWWNKDNGHCRSIGGFTPKDGFCYRALPLSSLKDRGGRK